MPDFFAGSGGHWRFAEACVDFTRTARPPCRVQSRASAGSANADVDAQLAGRAGHYDLLAKQYRAELQAGVYGGRQRMWSTFLWALFLASQ